MGIDRVGIDRVRIDSSGDWSVGNWFGWKLIGWELCAGWNWACPIFSGVSEFGFGVADAAIVVTYDGLTRSRQTHRSLESQCLSCGGRFPVAVRDFEVFFTNLGYLLSIVRLNYDVLHTILQEKKRWKVIELLIIIQQWFLVKWLLIFTGIFPSLDIGCCDWVDDCSRSINDDYQSKLTILFCSFSPHNYACQCLLRTVDFKNSHVAFFLKS